MLPVLHDAAGPPLRLAARDGAARGRRGLDRGGTAGAVPAPQREVEDHGHRARHGARDAGHGRGAGVTGALIVIAKEPAPGRSKTRLTPPLTAEAAAGLAAAALADTLAAAAACPAQRHVLALDGAPGDWVPPGFEVIPQRGTGLDERLASAFDDVAEPALLIGMDTPQVTPALLAAGVRALERPGTDAVLGPALDGGYWAIGLRRPRRELFLGVPMSIPT